MKKKKYAEALPLFGKSYSFFKKHWILDKHRWLFLLSQSTISYKEMALLNEAFCLGQLGRKEEAIKAYELVQQEYPESQMAEAALKMLK